jgi:anthranilate/para-aminobenzoate synthase component II
MFISISPLPVLGLAKHALGHGSLAFYIAGNVANIEHPVHHVGLARTESNTGNGLVLDLRISKLHSSIVQQKCRPCNADEYDHDFDPNTDCIAKSECNSWSSPISGVAECVATSTDHNNEPHACF